jgi:nicotinate-nucleotide pyrophosphorylase (carboxylating)
VSVPPLPADVRQGLASAGLDVTAVAALVDAALAEDLAGGEDVTSVATVLAGARASARYVARAAGVVAGVDVARLVLARAGSGGVVTQRRVPDGARVGPGDVLLVAEGPARELLLAERTSLNLLGHLSGVATLTRAWVDAVEGTGAAVRDTRKTTPLLRSLEKYAVRCGGGVNHRMSLSDAALVKDNHVIAAGGVVEAFARVRARFPTVPVEVEVDTLEDALAAVEAGADLVLLDNLDTDTLREAVRRVAGRARLEASGGLTLERAHEVAATGVDFLAVGALTHSAPVLDIALDFDVPEVLDAAGH